MVIRRIDGQHREYWVHWPLQPSKIIQRHRRGACHVICEFFFNLLFHFSLLAIGHESIDEAFVLISLYLCRCTGAVKDVAEV
jgi:hypothetical protein